MKSSEELNKELANYEATNHNNLEARKLTVKDLKIGMEVIIKYRKVNGENVAEQIKILTD
jgi:hypothetical protein